MSGHWPPEWDDPEEEFPGEADQLDATVLASGGEARLSEVAAYLASVPAPTLPEAVEARISAALAAEGATRANHAAVDDWPPPPLASGGRHRGSGQPRRRFPLRPATAAGSLAACLLLAVLGYALSRGSSPTYSGLAGAPSASSASAGSNAGSSSSIAAGATPVPSAAARGPQYAGAGSSFVVTVSGTKYQQATLAEQVRARLAPNAGPQSSGAATVPAGGATVPVASASSASADATSVGVAPGSALQGCVLHLTGGTAPRLVDRATYEGEPAYIIATSSRVWVVGLGCTAANTRVVASAPLAG
jgi:hypothetical protein